MKTLRDIPMLSGARLDGHASQFREEHGDFFLRVQRECGDIGTFRFFNVRVVVVSSPEVIHEVLVERAKSFEKGLAFRMQFHTVAGKGLFTSAGDLWRRQRKLMSPLFQPAAVRGYADMMNTVIARYLDGWRDGAVIDAGREMSRITMAVTGKALFDSDEFDDADEVGAAVQTVFEFLSEQAGSNSLIARAALGGMLVALGELPPWADALRERAIARLATPPRWLTAKGRALHAAIALLDAKIQQFIDDRRRAGPKRDLLTALLAARDDDGSVMTDHQLRDEAFTLFVAGYETTAIGATWTLALLGRHPEIYRRWKAEAAALGGRVPTADDAPRLGYAARMFKEAMRLYPPGFIIDRATTEEVEIGGYLLPKNTAIIISPYAFHRRPDLWPDPERFDPERFTPEAEAARPRLAWLGFGAGPRVCIGAQFAALEAQLLFAQIAQRFDLTLVSLDPLRASFESGLRPATPVLMRVRHADRHDRGDSP
jgi:cytochrome P450